MKEVKNFFEKNNRLNKGYIKVRNPNSLDHGFYRKKFEHVLPPIDTMQAYEDIYPGTLAKLVAMAEKEQLHRQAIDLKNLEINAKLLVKAKFCALIFMVISLLIFFVLSFCGKFVSAAAAACLIVATVIMMYTNVTHKKTYHRR